MMDFNDEFDAKPKVRKSCGNRPSEEQVIDALKVNRGNIAAAAEYLGITRQTVYNRMQKSEAIQAAAQEARESRKDFYERRLDDLAGEGNVAAVIFGLKTIARDRGYGEQVEVKGGGELHVHVGIAGVDDE